MSLNIPLIAAKMSEHRHAWVENIIRGHVPHWKILLVELTRSAWLSHKLIGVRIETGQIPSIHAGANMALYTKVYIKGVLVGDYKEYINARKTQPHE